MPPSLIDRIRHGNDPTFRMEGYTVCIQNVVTPKIVYWYDPEEWVASKCFGVSEGEPDMSISPRWFYCDVCKGKFPMKDYYDTWDWAGPHCPNPECGNGGMTLFANQHPPVGNAKGMFLHFAEEAIKTLNNFNERIKK